MPPTLALIVALIATSADDPVDPAAAAEVLARRIIGPDLGLSEVRLYAERRIPRMPPPSTVEAWEREADRMRSAVLDRVVYRGRAVEWRKLPTRVEWLETIEGGPGYSIRKLRYEAVPGLWVPALLYLPDDLRGKVPAVVNFDGHDPEGMYADYKQVRCINLAKRGVIALNVEWLGMGELKRPENAHGLLNAIDLSGTAGVAVFYGLQTRAVDVLLGLEHADPARIAATGLSGGGWQTIFLGSLDTRVKLVAPVAGYSSYRTRAHFAEDLGDSEQTPTDLATVTDYPLMTAMIAPRSALLTFNVRDNCCFAADHALPLLEEAARPVFRLYGREDHLRVFVGKDPGTHNYFRENRQEFYRVLGEEFFPGQAGYSAIEIPAQAEVKPAATLRVPLSPDNATLHSLALDLARDLPRDPALPATKDQALAWQGRGRERLRDLIKARPFRTVRADPKGADTRDGLAWTLWELNLDGEWTVPSVELSRGATRGTRIIIADGGRAQAAALAERAMADGFRVLVIDPFDVGESAIGPKDWLWHLYLAAVGDRAIGLRASQVAAVARWSSGRAGGPVSLLGDGPSSSLAALLAAAIEPDAVADVEVRRAPGSLKQPVEAMTPFDKSPDAYCFGLLEAFDVPQVVALIAPRKARFDQPTDRARAELKPLKTWYQTLGVDDFAPAP